MNTLLPRQRKFLLGLAIFSLPIFFNENFTGGWISIFVYMALILSGMSWGIFYIAKKIKIRPLVLFGFTVLLELGIYSSFFLVQKKIITSPEIQKNYHHFYTTYLRNIPSYQHDLGKYDPELFYRLQAGKSINHNFEFSNTYEINHQGLRDDEQSLDHPEIIVLGDSHAMGFGVNQEETFAQILEKKSNRKILNTAIISYGTARQFLLFQKLKTDSCKTLIWQYCPNDAIENQSFLENGNQLNISSKQEYRFCQYRNFLLAHYYPYKYTFETVAHQLRKLAFWKKKKNITINLHTQAKNFFAIVQLLQKDFQGEIIVLNLESSRTSDDLILEFEKYISQHGLENIRCLDFSKKLSTDDFNVIDEHLNAKGHQKIGNELFKNLQLESNPSYTPILSSQQ